VPRPVEMSKIKGRCQRRADLENDDHIDHEEWLELIDEAVGELYSIVADTGTRYFERVATLVTDGTNAIDEPASVMSTIGLWYVASSGKKTRLVPIMPHEREQWAGREGSHATRYELVDGYLYLYPTPPADQTYELQYLPQPPDVSGYASDQCVDVVIPEGLSFLVWAVVVKAKSKSEKDVRLATIERDRAAAKVQEWATFRALTEAPRKTVTDVDRVCEVDE
jgi:hypothetical protein